MRIGDNIRQRTDGRFEARYAKGRDERGRIVYGCCYGKTYEEAAAKRRAQLAQLQPVREMKLLILGAGSHGAEVKELAESLRIFRSVDFLDDDASLPNILGPVANIEEYAVSYPVAIPAVGNHDLRMRWLDDLACAGFVLPVLIHPEAVVSPSAKIGYGTVICASATVGSGAVIGRGCIISSGATVGRNAAVPDGTHIDCGVAVTTETKF